jgi:hypothetical protein
MPRRQAPNTPAASDLIIAQQDIARELIEEYNLNRPVYYTLASQPTDFRYSTLEDLLKEEAVIQEIIFDQRSRHIFAVYIRELPDVSFILVHQEFRDDILIAPPEYNSNGNKIGQW